MLYNARVAAVSTPSLPRDPMGNVPFQERTATKGQPTYVILAIISLL